MSGKFNLDKLDLQIIHEMMENAEISYADLGKKLFVSGGTIHVRIKKLQEFGIVKGTKTERKFKTPRIRCHRFYRDLPGKKFTV